MAGWPPFTMQHGKCELCGTVRDLHDSHYLPKGGYKRNRAGQLKNPNPVVISNGRAMQSSHQIRDYKFCAQCEKRFNDGGEAWVLSQIPADYAKPFPLHNVLDVSKAVRYADGTMLFPAANIPAVDLKKLVYFGMSLFWRGTRRWSPVDGGTPPKIYLNLKQEKAIRKFLLGKTTLPDDVVITVAIWPYKIVAPNFMVPRPDSGSAYRRYWFYYGGFIFLLAVGKNIPPRVRETCAYRNNVLTLNKKIGESVWESLRAEFREVDKSRILPMLEEVAAIKAKTPRSPQ